MDTDKDRPVKVKFCGLTSLRDVSLANALIPDYAGFVFAKKSRRYVDRELAVDLKGALDDKIKAVGVFVDEELSYVEELLNTGVIDLAQLHGNEDEGYIGKLRERTGRPVIRAFLIESPGDVKRAVESPADLILFDSGRGGGKVLDWELLRKVERPYFLAGGLTPENVAQAVSILRPFAVDVSSGIESDGKKNGTKMKAFMEGLKR